MTFIDPSRLWFLLVVPVLVVAYLLIQRRRRRYTLRFTSLAMLERVAPKRPAWRRHVAAVLMLTTVALLVTAFARPQREIEVPRERATIVLTIDVSKSMMAEDVQPSRLKAAQQAAKAFTNTLPPKFNLALVTFAGTAQVVVPPTTERQPVLSAIDELELANSTAIGEGILASLQALKQVPVDPEHPDQKPPARIALMTDGYQNMGRSVDSGIKAAQQAKVPIYTIAFGTPYGYVTLEGQRTPVPVDEATMRKVAEQTNGKSYTAASSEELTKVYSDIGSSIGYVTEEREVTSRWAGYALIAALCAAAVSMFFLGRLP